MSTTTNDEVLNFFQSLKYRLMDNGRLSEEDSLSAARHMYRLWSENCPEMVMSLWAILQRNVDVLFSVHPYIKKMVLDVLEGCPMPESYDWSDEALRRQRRLPDTRKAVGSYIDEKGAIVVELEPKTEKSK
jgi:hypothetical protein